MRPLEPGCLCVVFGTDFSDGKTCTLIKYFDQLEEFGFPEEVWLTDTSFMGEIFDTVVVDNFMYQKNLLRIDPDEEIMNETKQEEVA